MRRKESQELPQGDPESPVRTIRVKRCHMCGVACGKVMCDACGNEHLHILQAQLTGLPFPRASENPTENELTEEVSPTQISQETWAEQKQILLRMDGKPVAEEPPY